MQKSIHDSVITILEYPKNIKGHIFTSWLHPFKEHRLVVIGSRGMLTFEDSIEGKPLKYYDKRIKINRGIPEEIDGPSTLIKYEDVLPLEQELKYFINHLDGKKFDKVTSQHALDVITILVEANNKLGL